MAVINLIGETFADYDHAANAAALRDLTAALARTAPRACAVRVLLPQHVELNLPRNPRISTAQIPLPANMLGLLWHTNTAARPLDGEMLHAQTPLVPLRPLQKRETGTQVTVGVPHLAYLDQDCCFSPQQVKLQKNLLKRAVKHADVLIAPNFDVASRLQAEFGAVNVRVVSNAAPQEYIASAEAAARREELLLPQRYMVTTEPCDPDRLAWLTEAVAANTKLPPLVIITADAATPESSGAIAQEETSRVIRIQTTALSDYGAILGGADLLVLPHYGLTMAYEAYGAIANGVPILHAEIPAAAEIAVDAGAVFNSAESLQEQLELIFLSEAANPLLERLKILAQDRSKVYSWDTTALTLWEIHAAI